MRTAILRGRDHARLDRIAAIAEGNSAIALSLGGARKVYEYTDPNEDVAGFAVGERGALAVVADGHRGYEASEAAVDRLLTQHAARFVGADASAAGTDFSETAADVFRDVRAAIAEKTAGTDRGGARTTLAFAIVRPGDDLLAYASAGDSHIFRSNGTTAVEIGYDESVRSRYLAAAGNVEADGPEWIAHSETLAGTHAIVLVTDGLSETGIGVDIPAAAVSDAVRRAGEANGDLRPLETARGVVETALAAHVRNRSGDNAACAAIFVEDHRR